MVTPTIRSTWALVTAAGLALGGCGRQAYSASPAQPVPEQAVAAPGTTTIPAPTPTASLPPPPVPATFDVAALADQVKPMVVNITTTHDVARRVPEGIDPFDFFFGGPGGQGRGGPRQPRGQATALGTGFIIDQAGFVVTNAHVVEDADSVKVRLADDREFAADVVGRDPKMDLALLKLQGAAGLPAAPLGSSEQLRVGESVLAVGNPFGLGHTVTLGIVSAKARAIGAGPYDDFIQTDASINPGNSGGPLFNWKGEVVGINTAIRAGANGIGFAIPVDALKDVLPQLRDKGHVERGKLGLAFQPLTSELAGALGLDGPKGALVAEVEPGGAAARAGIKPGDVIVAVNGTPIVHAEELPRNVAKNPPNSAIKVSLARGKQRLDVTATLQALADDDGDTPPRRPGKSPATQSAGKLGLQISDHRGGGVLVEGLADGSPVKEIEPGDVIVEVNGAATANVEALRAALAKVKPGTTALVKVRRGKVTRFAALTIPR